MEKTRTIEFDLSGMSGICREYVGNVGNEYCWQRGPIFEYCCSMALYFRRSNITIGLLSFKSDLHI